MSKNTIVVNPFSDPIPMHATMPEAQHYDANYRYAYTQFPDAIVNDDTINSIKCSFGTCVVSSGDVHRLVYQKHNPELYSKIRMQNPSNPKTPNPHIEESDYALNKLPKVAGRYPTKIVCEAGPWWRYSNADICTISYSTLAIGERPYKLSVTRDYLNRS